MQSWPEDTSGGEGSVGGYVDLTGMPSRSEMLDHYATVSGRQVDDIDYYCVLAKWKLAVMLESTFQRTRDPERAASLIDAHLMKTSQILLTSPVLLGKAAEDRGPAME